jgi:hypothetical protein
LLPFIATAQSKTPTCEDLKFGVFHFYPKNSADHDLSIREGDKVHETNTKNSDTILWQIKWKDECTYVLKFISSNVAMSDETLKLVKKHKWVYEIGRITNEYYLFKGYVDDVSNAPIQIDTMWLNEKINRVSNELFKPVANSAQLKKANFSDTSKYAVLYLYRPKKLSNSLGNYLIYFNDAIMCAAKNNTGYLFKILKEGQFEIKSKLLKDEAAVKLDIKFGKTYYVKSMIHWGITSRLYNFRLEMLNMPAADAIPEFDEVDIQ